jgi:hypothetical protein
MKERLFKLLINDRVVRHTLSATLLLIVLSLLFITLTYNHLPPVMPIYNQLPWGIERLSSRLTIFLPTAVTATFLVGNTLLIQLIYDSSPLLARILGVTNALIGLLSFIFTVRTTLLVT